MNMDIWTIVVESPSLYELRGTMPNLTDGVPSEEYVRRMREPEEEAI